MNATQPQTDQPSAYITRKTNEAIAAGVLARVIAGPAHYTGDVIERDYHVPSASRAGVSHTVTCQVARNKCRCTCEASTQHDKSWCWHREAVVRYERMIAARANGAY